MHSTHVSRSTSTACQPRNDIPLAVAGKLRRELIACLRWSRGKRRAKTRAPNSHEYIADMQSIHLRPKSRDEQARLTDRTHGRGVYFYDPHRPWQRGLNENTNGLLVSICRRIQACRFIHRSNYLNTRPRKSLGFRSPVAQYRTGKKLLSINCCGWVLNSPGVLNLCTKFIQ